MSEETTETTETTTTETTDTAPQSFIDGEGNFKEGWEGAYLTEDQRGHARVAGGRVKSVQGMLATIINSDKMIDGETIRKPSDNFGDADWDAYHTAGGWTNQPIEIAAPEGLPEGLWSDDRAKRYSDKFNELRFNPKQVAGIMEFYHADLAQQITDSTNNQNTAVAELKAALLAEKGNAFTQFEHNGNLAIEKGAQGDADFKARVVAKYGTDPDLVRLLGNLGSRFNESGFVPKAEQAATPDDVQDKINAIMNSDAFMKPMHPEHASTMKKLRQLHDEKVKVRLPA